MSAEGKKEMFMEGEKIERPNSHLSLKMLGEKLSTTVHSGSQPILARCTLNLKKIGGI